MRRAYLLVYSPTLGTREELKTVLNELPEVIHWRRDMPNSFVVISEESAKSLSQKIRDARGEGAERGRFIVTELAANTYGWLPPDSWYLINKKFHKHKN